MKILDKTIAFLFLLLIAALCIFFIAAPIEQSLYITAAEFITMSFAKPYRWYFFAGAIVVLLITIKVILGFMGVGERKNCGVFKNTENGEMFISNDTLKAIVLKAVSLTKGIRDTTVFVHPGRENVTILIKTIVQPDINIPQLVSEIQVNVKKHIQDTAEIPVGEVKVSVTGMSTSTAMRVQ